MDLDGWPGVAVDQQERSSGAIGFAARQPPPGTPGNVAGDVGAVDQLFEALLIALVQLDATVVGAWQRKSANV